MDKTMVAHMHGGPYDGQTIELGPSPTQHMTTPRCQDEGGRYVFEAVEDIGRLVYRWEQLRPGDA